MTVAQLTAPVPIDVLAQAYQQVRSGTEALAAPLSAEDQTVQSMADASPTKWHRAHTSWFFETFLLEASHAGYQVFHPAFTFLFNSYYEQVGARHPRPQRGVVSRPGIAEIAAYRRHVDAAMADLLASRPPPETRGLVELGLHHEQQHQELLLMDVKHALSCNALLPVYAPGPVDPFGAVPAEVPALSWDEHHGGPVSIGHREHQGFCFDNELPRHQVLLAPFAMASRPVTCGEWVDFVEDGGYLRPELWLSDGWGAVQSGGWTAPLYWTDVDGHWEVFTLHGRRPLHLAEPVCHVSYYEADAFARWAGARLPTEAEWEAVATAGTISDAGAGASGAADAAALPAATGLSSPGATPFSQPTAPFSPATGPTSPGTGPTFPGTGPTSPGTGPTSPSTGPTSPARGPSFPSGMTPASGTEVPKPEAVPDPPAHAWASVVGALHPRPVGSSAPLAGDVWQWTQSAYSPYPGYRPAPGAVGEYNGKFMVNQYVLRGGSCVTPWGHTRVTYRNFFPASARWPFAGVRLAADR